MVFSESGIASMPSNIKPLRDTEYKYRDERDIGHRKTKPTTDTKTHKPLPHVEAPASTIPNDPKSTQSEPEPTTDQPSQELNSDESDTEPDNPSENSSDETDKPTRAEQSDKGKNPPRKNRNSNPHYASSVVIDDVTHDVLTISSDAIISDITIPKSYEKLRIPASTIDGSRR